jgi:enoyl-CoA hydratase/carnithine racemase
LSAESPDELVRLQRHDGYAVVELNRPEKRNAMNNAAQAQLAAILDSTRDCRVIVLTGAGDISFCAGVDVTERANLGATQTRRLAWEGDSWFEIQERIMRHPAVFIAAVNGYALGGGLTLVNNCELAVAAETASFGMPEVTIGAFPALAGPSTVHRILNKHVAYLVFTGERIDAATAMAWGLVNEVVPASQLLIRATELARSIATADPNVLDYAKRALRELPDLPWSQSIEYGLRTGALVRQQIEVAQQGNNEKQGNNDQPSPGERPKP